MEIVLASGNAKKAAELERMLEPLGFRVLRPVDVGGLPDVEEDRETFEGNAEKKAVSAAAHSGRLALADDSGLCVDALGGGPGVHSARYAGVHGDDEANNRKLLDALQDIPGAGRGAHFVCCLVVADPDGKIVCRARGEVHGRIGHGPKGDGGFGYDPLFRVRESGNPFDRRPIAELTPAEKAAISHRGRALAELVRQLKAQAPSTPR
ncbi:MAG: RdgB/HAM1 family non-canonical purine NTP pyrophosphatase [Planctomycetota bacterium]